MAKYTTAVLELENNYQKPQRGTFIDNGGAVCNVRHPDYAGGAKGDGEADDTSALLAARTAAIALGHNTVFLPPGSYKVSAVADLSGVTLIGDGATLVGNKAEVIQVGDMARAATITQERTVRIPSDYPTLQAAIDDLASRTRGQGVRIVLLLESGYRPSQGVAVKYGDYSHFVVRSEDPVVTVADNFTGIMFHGTYAAMPVLDALIDMARLGDDGYIASQCSTGRILEGAGIMNCGPLGSPFSTNNIQAERSSRIDCEGAIATGAGRMGIYSTRASVITALGADVSGAGLNGLFAFRGGVINAGPHPTIGAAKAVGCGTQGAFARAGIIYCPEIDVSGSENGLMATEGGKIQAENAVATDCTVWGVLARGAGSTVQAEGADASRAGAAGFRADRGGIINARNSKADDSGGDAFYATAGGVIDATGASGQRATTNGLLANGGRISADGANVTGAGHRGVWATNGGVVSAPSVVASGAVSSCIHASSAGVVNCAQATATDGQSNNVMAESCGVVNCEDAVVTGAGHGGILADTGATINCKGADASGAVNIGVRASNGARVVATDANGQRGENTSTQDFVVESGGTIVAFGATGGVSQEPNTLTSAGVIFRDE